MLAIRLQRTGRKGHAQYRVVVQDARKSPTSGKVIKYVGHYNPHTKKAEVKKEEVELFLKNGARPSDRVARLLKAEGVKLPKWVVVSAPKKRDVRNPEKLQKADAGAPAPAAEASDSATEAPAEPAAEAPKEEVVAETAEEPKPEAEAASEEKTEDKKEEA